MTNTTTDAAEARALPRYLSDRFQWAAPGDQQEDAWIVRFCDNDLRDMLFTGPDAEREAWDAWERHAPGYNMYVFRLARLATAEAASGAGEREEWTFTPDTREAQAIAQLSEEQELSPQAVMRQALRLYQADFLRRKAGETVTWSGDEQRARDFAGPLASLPPATDPAMVEASPIIGLIDPVLKQAEQSGNTAGLWLFASQWQTIRAALAAAPTIPATGETWESVAAWCEQTFGPCTPYRMATRAGEELAELVEEAQSLSWSDKARIEAADVLICLSRVPGIWAAVEEKMAINRARKWNLQGDGTGYHIPATGHAATEGEG